MEPTASSATPQNGATCTFTPVAREALLRERLEVKRQNINTLLAATHTSWEEAFYISLARAFGFHTNSRPMEQLTQQTPLAYLNKHHDSLFQLTALLLGQSGLLAEWNATDTERQQLLNEYHFLAKKFSLNKIDPTQWRRAGVPVEIRIRQFALLLQQSESLFSKLMEESDIEKMVALFTPEGSEQTAPQRLTLPPAIGRRSIEGLLINVVFPYQYAYHLWRNNAPKAEQVLHLYEGLPAEDNYVVRRYQASGYAMLTAADSQAALQETSHYGR